MTEETNRPPSRILIVSSHPLFGKGIGRLVSNRGKETAQVVGIVSTVEEAMKSLETHTPDLVVVDYDDGAINRDEFLARFVEGEYRLRIVMVSLKEGSNIAIVYDRRNMIASQVDDWLMDWIDDGV